MIGGAASANNARNPVFSAEEHATRLERAEAALAARGLDGMLVFAPESQFWLAGIMPADVPCRMSCLILGGREPVLVTCADSVAAAHCSTIEDVRPWSEREGADPGRAVAAAVLDLGLAGRRLGVETEIPGPGARTQALIAAALEGSCRLITVDDLFPGLMRVRSESEIIYLRRAAELAEDGLEAARDSAAEGCTPGQIVAALQSRMLAQGGGWPGPGFSPTLWPGLISDRRARRGPEPEPPGRRLRWAGVHRHYHAAMMTTMMTAAPDGGVGAEMHAEAIAALHALEGACRPGRSFGAAHEAQTKTLDEMGSGRERQDICGHALGAWFSAAVHPGDLLRAGSRTEIRTGMTLFLRVALRCPQTGIEAGAGRTVLVTPHGAEPLGRELPTPLLLDGPPG
ncbi:MAG: aminopeptidase P family protein [Rhodobacteraceae bacterium]|nr:aminopeptidase P family protein [Paracoccaceae bacterium]